MSETTTTIPPTTADGSGAPPAPADAPGLWTLLKEAHDFNERSWFTPGCHTVAVHRITNWAKGLPAPVGLPIRVLCRIGYYWCRNVYGIEVPAPVKLGRRFTIGHQSGIVLHPHVEFGDDCTVRNNVTIGAPRDDRYDEFPTFGHRVQIGAGAAIIGRVHVGDDARIGPNAVVTTDIPAGYRAVAPATVVEPRSRSTRPSA